MRWNSKFIPMLDWDARHQLIELDLGKISAVASTPSDSDNGGSVNIDIATSAQEEKNELTDETVDHRSHQNSNSLQTEDTMPHKLANGSTWELSDDYGEEATIKRRGDHAADEADSDANSPSKGEEENGDQGRVGQRRSSRFSYEDHDHHLTGNLDQRPMSLLQRRVRVRNRSRCVLLNGMYQQALAASWPSLLLSLVVVYLAVVAAIAMLMTISVRQEMDEVTCTVPLTLVLICNRFTNR